MTSAVRARLALTAALALTPGCAGHGDASSTSTSAPQASAAAAPSPTPQPTPTWTPYDPSKPLAPSARCLGSFAEGSELMSLVAQNVPRPGPITGCVSTGTWAIVRWSDPDHPIASLLAVKEDGHWKHVAHGPKFIAVKDMLAVSDIDPATARRLEKMELRLK